MTRALCRSIAAAISIIAVSAVAAQADDPAPVSTRARLTSLFEEPDGKLYVRLKILPRAKIPFTTQTFRLPDRALVSGIPEGSWVKFTSKNVDGENIVTSIRVVAECMRFQPCD
jgi:Cu/Ag efflux protein CusF